MSSPVYSQPPPVPPAPSQRQTPVWVWVLAGLAVLAVLCVTVAAGIGYYMYKTVTEHPGQVVAKLLTLSNPDIEVLQVDERKGLMAVRDKKQNKTFTISLAEAKEGKIKVVDEDGKETVAITADRQEGIRVQGGDGKQTFQLGGDVQLPAWVPAYPGVAMEGGAAMDVDEGKTVVASFRTKDGSAKVLAYYEAALKQAGLTEESRALANVNNETNGMVTWKDEARGRTISLLLGSDGGETAGNLTVNEKGTGGVK